MPIHMRMRKLRGPNMKKSMPFEPFRTHTQPVNLDDLEARFDAGAEVDARRAARKPGSPRARASRSRSSAKGELTKPLTVHAHGFSGKAREAIEAAGGTCVDHRGVAVRSCARMVATILSAFTVAEIRKKLAVHGGAARALPARLAHPGPGRQHRGRRATIQEQFGGGGILNLLNMFSGGGLSRIALFALGIMPYITASIILQLLTVVVAVAGEAPEGGRGRAGADHAVHALPDRRPRRSPRRSATSSSSARSRPRAGAAGHRQLQRRHASS